jgi:hypothetical protein
VCLSTPSSVTLLYYGITRAWTQDRGNGFQIEKAAPDVFTLRAAKYRIQTQLRTEVRINIRVGQV